MRGNHATRPFCSYAGLNTRFAVRAGRSSDASPASRRLSTSSLDDAFGCRLPFTLGSHNCGEVEARGVLVGGGGQRSLGGRTCQAQISIVERRDGGRMGNVDHGAHHGLFDADALGEPTPTTPALSREGLPLLTSVATVAEAVRPGSCRQSNHRSHIIPLLTAGSMEARRSAGRSS